jgi:hypothetical protein
MILESIYDGDSDWQNMALALRRAFEETHARVSNRTKSRCDASHSGTTATVALLEDRELLIGTAMTIASQHGLMLNMARLGG